MNKLALIALSAALSIISVSGAEAATLRAGATIDADTVPLGDLVGACCPGHRAPPG